MKCHKNDPSDLQVPSTMARFNIPVVPMRWHLRHCIMKIRHVMFDAWRTELLGQGNSVCLLRHEATPGELGCPKTTIESTVLHIEIYSIKKKSGSRCD